MLHWRDSVLRSSIAQNVSIQYVAHILLFNGSGIRKPTVQFWASESPITKKVTFAIIHMCKVMKFEIQHVFTLTITYLVKKQTYFPSKNF